MLAKIPRSERPFARATRRMLALVLTGLPLLCSMDALHASKRRSNVQPEDRSPTSTWEERSAPLAAGQRIFDATVRLRLDALLALSALELGQRECSAATPKEQVRGRLDRAVVLAANEQLTLPMGAGSVLSVAGRPYLFCLEPHYHPPGGGITPEGWHKGVTVYHAPLPSVHWHSSDANPT